MPARTTRLLAALGLGLLLLGCNSPYRSDRGALAGGLGGAGIGALVGEAVGHPGVGAAVGAGVGAVSGAAIGGALDDIDARNQAQIAAQLGRPVPAGAVRIDEVVNMTRAGVNEELIVNHIRTHGVATQLQANDLIVLQQQGVSTRVVQAMQTPPVAMQPVQPMVVQPVPAPIMVQGYYGPPPPYPYYRAWRPSR